MVGYVKIQDILDYCEKVVKVHESLIERALDKDGPASNVSAAAFFMQQERVYKYDIPNMLKELGGVDNPILKESIWKLDLSNTSINVLSRNKIETVEQLSNMTIRDLRALKGCGAKIAEEITRVLETEGIKMSK